MDFKIERGIIMAKYVDLSLETDSHAGTDVDPYSPTDFRASLSAHVETEYFIRGTHSFAPVETIDSSAVKSFYKWGSAPYRISLISPEYALRGTWKDGIIMLFESVTMDQQFSWYDMFIKVQSDKAIFIHNTSINTVKGSTICGGNIIFNNNDQSNTINAIDTVFDCGFIVPGGD